METNSSFLEKTFSLNERKTNAKTEFLAGLTTFMTMSYILVVNPNMLSETGMDKGGELVNIVPTPLFCPK